MKRKILLLTLLSIFIFAQASFAIWEPAGTLNIPQYSYGFIATSRTGDLMVAAFNSVSLDAPDQSIPALLIKNPDSQNPEVIKLCSVSFPAQRGYSGLACDESGNFYLSGDTANPGTSFVKKFKANGEPDQSFGNGGEIKPNKRCLGVDTIGGYLFLAVDWGKVRIFNAQNGGFIAELPEIPGIYVRDIAVDPSSYRIYGVGAGSVVVWEGGTPANPTGYRYRILSGPAAAVRSVEGISYDPISRSAVICPVPGNVLFEVLNNGTIRKSATISKTPNAHYGDIALSFDGQTIFITDILTKKIHIMKRSVNEKYMEIAPAFIPKPPLDMAAPQALQPITWNKSYTAIVDKTRFDKKPMVVYFRKNGFQKCVDFENNVLLKEEFKSHGQNFVCVFEEVDLNPLIAYKFGVYRTPHIVVLDKQGETIARYTFNIKPEILFNAMDSLNSAAKR